MSSLPPGPKGVFLLGNLLDRLRDPLGLFLSTAKEYGDIVYLPMAHVNLIVVTGPELAKVILQDHAKNYIKGKTYDGLRKLTGNGLLTSVGENWRYRRRMTQPAFHKHNVEAQLPVFEACAEDLISGWQNQSSNLNLVEEMNNLTLSVASRSLFGSGITREDALLVSRNVGYMIEQSMKDIFRLVKVPSWIPTPTNLRMKKALTVMNDVLSKIIHPRVSAARANPDQIKKTKHSDLLELILAAKDEETGLQFTEEQIKEESVSFFLAGHETSANALIWTLILLAQHPEVRKKLEAEVDAFREQPMTSEGYGQLKYCEAVILESMRLFPPVWSVAREAVEDDEVGGYKIPKGYFVAVNIYVMNRSPKLWDQPDVFMPERFLEGRVPTHKAAYIPFSMGPRGCIGASFAMLEMVCILSRLVQNFRVNLVPGHPIVPEPVITLRPKFAVPIQVVRR